MTSLTSEQLRGAAASISISTLFAFAWGLSGGFALPGLWQFLALALVTLLTLLFGVAAFRFQRAARKAPAGAHTHLSNPFRTASYRFSVLAMLIAFPIAGRLLTASGYPGAIMPVIAIIVGLHFLGLVRAFRSGLFVWVALGFCLVGGAALLLPLVWEGVALRQAVVGLGCAAVLWLGVTPLCLRMRAALER